MPDFSTYRVMPLDRRSPLDPRDYPYSPASAGEPILDVAAAIAAGVLPSSVDLCADGMMPPIWDQGSEGSCAGHASAAALVHAYLRSHKPLAERVSPAYVYYRGRAREGWQNSDTGSYIRDDLQSMIDSGACLEHLMPYVAGQFALAPSLVADTDAGNQRVARYELLASYLYVCQALGQDRRPVVLGTNWYPEWDNIPDGIMPIPASQPRGAHAPLFCGYAYINGVLRFKLHNSWGTFWGQQGHGWLQADQADRFVYERWVAYGAVESQPQPRLLSQDLAGGVLLSPSIDVRLITNPTPPTPPNPPQPLPNDVEQVLAGSVTDLLRLLIAAGVDVQALVKTASTATA